ncbi:hypothetical protein BHYA_0125g00090 [Botrytis hyacinthi]|uniref:Uncharacterized protein n=1 Tax=Botrytis hyacinthi TaxID=278943 RepID=A0A4Z1GS04_9HELO|nr:hypothetical protein BHYA_0125g00090 [Botrytis hyacinthi]
MAPQKLPAQTKMSVGSSLKKLPAENKTPMLSHYLYSPGTAIERLANNLPASSSSRSEKKMEEVLKDLMGVLKESHNDEEDWRDDAQTREWEENLRGTGMGKWNVYYDHYILELSSVTTIRGTPSISVSLIDVKLRGRGELNRRGEEAGDTWDRRMPFSPLQWSYHSFSDVMAGGHMRIFPSNFVC